MLKLFLFTLSSLLLAGADGILLRDPQIYPCSDYDLFDPVERKLSSNGDIAEDPETLTHEIVHQLNARRNGMYKFMVVRLISQRTSASGKSILTFYTAESRCRNDGRFSTSLYKCPFKENGKVELCNVTISPMGTTIRSKMQKFACKSAPFMEAFGEETTMSLYSMDGEEVITVGGGSLIGFRAPTLENFRCFAMRFKKSYATDEERQLRFGLFQANMKRAYLYQITEQGTAVYGPTQFSDLSMEEFRRMSTGLKPTENWAENLKPAKVPELGLEDLPATFDWRNKSAVTPVEDQGQCGSCWAFSAIGNIEGQWAIKKGELVVLSEQELVDCDKLDQGCGGGLPSDAYKSIIELGGVETAADYPYDGRDDKCSFQKPKSRVYINDSVVISQNETEMAIWLVKNGPISIGINANAMMLYMGGISHPWRVVCSPKNLDHGVLIVGYGKDGKNPFWIVKNSWGAHWGVRGYYLVYRGDGTCGLNLMCTSAVVL